MPKPTNPLFYEFDEFRVDAERRLLFRRDEQVQLTPKVFDTLLVFLENRGEVLDKDRLMRELWSDSFVEESNITQNVAVLRKALGERSKENRFIVTIPGRGYRFVADVACIFEEGREPAETNGSERTPVTSSGNVVKLFRPLAGRSGLAFAAEENAEVEPEISIQVNTNGGNGSLQKVPAAAAPPRSLRFPLYYVAAALAGVLVVTTAAYLLSPRTPSVTSTAVKKIAVLPLEPVNADNRDRSLELAIADSLILKLSESKNFAVMRLGSVRKFVELDKDPIEAGRELNVDYVLASNYQIADGRIRVTSQLLNVSTGAAEQSLRSETGSGNVFSMQDAIANEIGNALFKDFDGPAGTYALKRGTENEEAYRLYHEAWYLIDKNTTDNAAKAAELLARAVELDPNYAQAWAAGAYANCQFAHLGGGRPSAQFVVAGPMLEKALALDSNNAVAYAIRGSINRDYHWKFPEAYKDLQRSIELDPNLNIAHRELALLYERDGKPEAAIEAGKRAIDLNPTSLLDKWLLADYLVAAGRVDEGIAQLHRVTEMYSSFPWAYDSLWGIYHRKGEKAKAFEYFIKAKESFGGKREAIDQYKSAYEKNGWDGVLRKELDLIRSKDPRGAYSPSKYWIAVLASQVGETDLAFQYLEEAIEYRLISVSYLKVDPMLEGLRGDPRFNDLVKRVGI